MKLKLKKIACIMAIATAAATMSSGCGMQIDATLNSDMTSTVKEKIDLSDIEHWLLYEGGESEYKKTEVDGETRYILDTEYHYTKKDLDDDFQVKASDKYIIIRGESLMQADKGANINIKLPFKIAATNGKKVSDDTVHFDTSMIDMKTEDMKKPQYLYAVADESLVHGKDLQIKGVKNGGVYKKAPVIRMNSKDGIFETATVHAKGEAWFNDSHMDFKDQTISVYNDGVYTLTAKLFGNDSVKKIKFTVDSTKPTVNIKNGKTYKKGQKITFKDATSGIKSAKLDGKIIKSGTKVSKKGNHTLMIMDKAGNLRKVSFKTN